MFLIDFHLFFLHLCTQGGGRVKIQGRGKGASKSLIGNGKANLASIILIYTRSPFTVWGVWGLRSAASEEFSYFPSRAPAERERAKNLFAARCSD